jgi:hypothetical protein
MVEGKSVEEYTPTGKVREYSRGPSLNPVNPNRKEKDRRRLGRIDMANDEAAKGV